MKEFAFQMWKLRPPPLRNIQLRPPVMRKLKIRIPDSRQGSSTLFIVLRWTPVTLFKYSFVCYANKCWNSLAFVCYSLLFWDYWAIFGTLMIIQLLLIYIRSHSPLLFLVSFFSVSLEWYFLLQLGYAWGTYGFKEVTIVAGPLWFLYLFVWELDICRL